MSNPMMKNTMQLNSNIRCIEIALVADEIIPSIRLNSNIRCIEI